jgi:orotidine-5'-phosphate decarboxylase
LDPHDRLIVALDVGSLDEATVLAGRLSGLVRWFKVGAELFTAAGPAAVEALGRHGRVFLDLKYHDIPATVSGAADAASRLGVAMCTVHALGGTAMMAAARDAVARGAAAVAKPRPAVIGVTLLTSGSMSELEETGVMGTPLDVTLRLARLARDAGMDGVVASPHEAARLRAEHGAEFLVVCPGIRARESAGDDQRRVCTVRQAIAAGADFLVVGRPITRAGDPAAAASEIIDEINRAALS